MVFLFFGYITCVPEIQEFCTFAFIGLVVDFYMQLFFYAPCLTFDLQRLDNEEKRKFGLKLFNTDIKKLKNYSKPRCPAESIMPSLFAKHRHHRLFRTLSDTGVEDRNFLKTNFFKSHRRTSSTEKIVMVKRETLVSNRLRLLYYWTKTRFFHRLLMIFFSFWVLWLAFIVHKWRLFDVLKNTIGSTDETDNALNKCKFFASCDGFGISHHLLETAPLEWSEWQRNTFKWWPALFGEYNISLSGHYVTFAPPIVLRATILPSDISLMKHNVESSGENTSDQLHSGNNHSKLVDNSTENPELGNRIYWLERQMTAMLLISTLLPFSIVVGFILYIFWDKWTSYRKSKQAAAILRKSTKLHSSIKNEIYVTPLLFARHDLDIECVGIYPPSTVVSASLGGQILIWDSVSGELKHTLHRLRHPQSLSNAKPTSIVENNSSTLENRLLKTPIVNSQLDNLTTIRKDTIDSKQPLLDGATTQNNLTMVEQLDKPGCYSTRYIRVQAWCMDVKQTIVAIGYSSGSFELYSLAPNFNRISGYTPEEELTPGITQIKIISNRIILARLNGTLETYEFNPVLSPIKTTSSSTQKVNLLQVPIYYNIQKLTLTRAHQKPVIQLLCTSNYVITSSFDCTIKVYDIRSPQMRVLYTLNGHDHPLASICADGSSNVLFSCCDAGLILCWSMEDGKLIQKLDNEPTDENETTFELFDNCLVSSLSTELQTNTQFLIGFNISSKVLTIWNKYTLELISRITPAPMQIPSCYTNSSSLTYFNFMEDEALHGCHLLILNEFLAITSSGIFLYIWNLDLKALLRQIRLPKSIDKIYEINHNSLLCCCGSAIYVVTLPSAISQNLS